MTVGEPPFVRTLEAYGQSPVIGGNAVEVLLNGDQFFPRELAAIRAARTSITYTQYFWADGDVAREMAEALAERCRAGVAVHVLLDGFGTLAMPGEHIDRMEAAGCQVARFRPLSSLFSGRFNHRNHRRILVVDGAVGFTGGAGVSDKWKGDGRQPGRWRDTTIEVRGPVVQFLQAAFVDSWTEATGTVLGGARYFPPLGAEGTVAAQVVSSAPAKGELAIYAMFLLVIESAQHSILITNPYFVPDERMTEALLAATGRGVRVVVLAPGEIDHNLVRLASRRGYGRLLTHQVEIHEYRAALLHAKTMVVDGRWATVGTTNFDSRSFTLNREVNVALYDRGLAARLESIFADDLTRARRVTYAGWRSRSCWQRLLEIIALPIRDQL